MVGLANGMGAVETWVPFSRVREGTLRQDGRSDKWNWGSSRDMGKADQDVQLGNQVIQEQHRL